MRKLAFALCAVLVLAAATGFVASVASAAAKKAKAPASTKRSNGAVVVDTTTMRVGPMRGTVRRDSTRLGRTTIAPYPVPSDTSRAAARLGRVLNVPKSGVTTVAPLPQPVPSTPLGEQQKMSANTGALPKWGDYVHVTELPEVIERVAPAYPAEAREKGIQGTVMVKALVLKDGSVSEAHAMQQIPYLSAAAEEIVRRWRFKPAMDGQNPVAVWVSTPVKFTLH